LNPRFAHEQLQVYGKALSFGAKVNAWTGIWNKKHALVDQLYRASESLLINLAEAARQRNGPARLQQAEYAIGSSLECAGCLDLAGVKKLLCPAECQQEKRTLCEVTRMLVGLRKAWEHDQVREEAVADGGGQSRAGTEPLFYHERLEVYRAALGFMDWFVSQPEGEALSHRLARQIDEAGTCVVLNIAEGNGRFSVLDHHRFLQIADRASVKAAVYLDLAVEKGLVAAAAMDAGKELLRRVSAMLEAF
jgi:four helix bundle protein